MHFDFEGFGERNAIRSALAGSAPSPFDHTGLARLLRRALRRDERPREQARAA